MIQPFHLKFLRPNQYAALKQTRAPQPHRGDITLLKMLASNQRQVVTTKVVTASWDLKGVPKRSIAFKLKQHNKKSSTAIKNALASMLESKTLMLDNN